MGIVRKSLLLSIASKYSDLVISFVSVIILARLLTPAEIGIYSVGMGVVILAHVLRDFGVGNYLIQEQELTRERIQTAFGVAILIAWSLAGILFLLSQPVAEFYSEPRLKQFLRVFSITFIIFPLNTPILALLRRELSFGVLYVISVTNSSIHAGTAITLALSGYGFMSLVWASLAGTIATLVVTTIWRPSEAWVLPSIFDWRHIARYGGITSLTGIVTQAGTNSVDLIVGRILGFTAAGLFSRANGLIAIFQRDLMSAINQVALPALAIEYRNNSDVNGLYLRGVSLVTVIAWPFYGFLLLMAFPVIRILFGDQWDDAVPLVQILTVAAAIGATWNLIGQVLIACGEIDRVLKSELIIQPARILLIFGAVPFGLEAVAASQIIFFALGAVVYHRGLAQVMGISLNKVIPALFASVSITIWSLIGPIAVHFTMNMGPTNFWLPFIMAFVSAGIGWIVGAMISNHPIKSEILIAIRTVPLWNGRA